MTRKRSRNVLTFNNHVSYAILSLFLATSATVPRNRCVPIYLLPFRGRLCARALYRHFRGQILHRLPEKKADWRECERAGIGRAERESRHPDHGRHHHHCRHPDSSAAAVRTDQHLHHPDDFHDGLAGPSRLLRRLYQGFQEKQGGTLPTQEADRPDSARSRGRLRHVLPPRRSHLRENLSETTSDRSFRQRLVTNRESGKRALAETFRRAASLLQDHHPVLQKS